MKSDRLAFLDDFATNFFSAGTELKVSESVLADARDVAAGASPKGTLDCIAAFGRNDIRDDVAKMTVPTLIIHGDSDGIVPFAVSGKRSAEASLSEFNEALLAFVAR